MSDVGTRMTGWCNNPSTIDPDSSHAKCDGWFSSKRCPCPCHAGQLADKPKKLVATAKKATKKKTELPDVRRVEEEKVRKAVKPRKTTAKVTAKADPPPGRKRALGRLERVCKKCNKVFKRPDRRGRPPLYCPKCRG